MSVNIVLVTCPAEEAHELASALIKERLVACVNIIPGILSVYRWKEDIEQSEESLLLLKTMENKVQLLKERVIQLHSYDTPEFIVVETELVEHNYAKWLESCVDPKNTDESKGE